MCVDHVTSRGETWATSTIVAALRGAQPQRAGGAAKEGPRRGCLLVGANQRVRVALGGDRSPTQHGYRNSLQCNDL
eukprot:1699416-Prymnesium_polylepis.1